MSEELEKLHRELFELKYQLSTKEQIDQTEAFEAAGWPWALVKAINDPFDYALGLRDGTIIFFECATQLGKNTDWVLLTLSDTHSDSNAYRQSFNYKVGVGKARGIEVRVSDIVWASDAPYGS